MRFRVAAILERIVNWLRQECIVTGCDFPRYQEHKLCKMHQRLKENSVRGIVQGRITWRMQSFERESQGKDPKDWRN